MNVLDSPNSAPPHPGDLIDPARPIVGFARETSAALTIPRHRHRRGQVVYASAGVITVHTDAATWAVPPQQAVWMPPEVEHEVASVGPMLLRSLYLDPSVARAMPKSCAVLGVTPLLRELILAAVEAGVDYPPGGAVARLMAVIVDRLRTSALSPLELPLPTDARLTAVTRALLDDPADARGLDAWARVAGASPRTLARLFQRQTGMGFGAWRQRLRLLEAIARLGQGSAVTSVAYDLGYRSPSAFIAMFKRALGAPPGRYLRGCPSTEASAAATVSTPQEGQNPHEPEHPHHL